MKFLTELWLPIMLSAVLVFIVSFVIHLVLPIDKGSTGKNLASWFVFSLFVSVLVAYVGWHALMRGAGYLPVFRITGAAAVLGYAAGHFHDSIWKDESLWTTGKLVFEGVIYGLVTAGTFGWLWPELF